MGRFANYVICIIMLFGPRLESQQTNPSQHASIPVKFITATPGSASLAVIPNGRPTIGIALEGGGALGLAHIGVLAWFEENHIPIDAVAGTSMGALIGGLYAAGTPVDDIKQLATSGAFKEIFTTETAYADLDFRRKEDRKDLPQAFSLGLKGGVTLRNSILPDAALNALLRKRFGSYNRDDLSFNNLPIAFRCVATDLNDLAPIVFDEGSLADAVRASISIPGVFPPVRTHEHYIVDGAIVDNLPTDVLKHDLHPDITIAVHLESASLSDADVNSILGIVQRAYGAGTVRSERTGRALADIPIDVATARFTTLDYAKGAELIQTGYEAAEAHRSELIRYRLQDAQWQAYLDSRRKRASPPPGILQQAVVDGGSLPVQASTLKLLQPLKGQPIDPDTITDALRRVEGNGAYTTSFSTSPSREATPTDGTTARQPDTGIIVHLNHRSDGPPFLMIGGDLTAVTSNVTRSTVAARFVYQDLGGLGSELRVDARAGFLTQGSVEYYKRISPGGLFLQPHLGIVRQPVYIWADQKRISERFEQQAGGGIDIGRTFTRNTQLAAEWRSQVLRWEIVTGQDGLDNLSGNAQTGVLHFIYDSAIAAADTPRGLRIDVSAGELFHTVASRNAPLFQMKIAKTYALSERNILGFSSEVNSYFRRNVASPLLFTLGGPLRLSASSIDEYRGTDDFIVRSGYQRRIFTLPSGIGQGVYLAFAYEAGEMWSTNHTAFVRQDGVGGIVASTPLGVITLAGSVGDAGRRKVILTLGKLF
jgi:NTE family protein